MSDPNDITIPEMQKIKEKYPEYKDTPDIGLLNSIARKFPVYQPIADRVAGEIIQKRKDLANGSITEGQPSIADRISSLNEKLGYGDTYLKSEPSSTVGAVKDLVAGAGEEALRTITLDRPFGATKALVAGGNPIEGFKNPDTQPSFGESAVKAYGLDLNNNYHLGAAALVDSLANIGVTHLLFGVPIQAVRDVKAAYTGAQGKELTDLKEILTKELSDAGIGQKAAEAEAGYAVAKQFQTNSFLKNTPGAIKQTTDILRANPGKLADTIKALRAQAEDNAAKQGFTNDFFKQARESNNRLVYRQRLGLPLDSRVTPGQVIPLPNDYVPPPELKFQTTTPATDFGRQIQTQVLKKDDIPLHPASEGRAALAQIIFKSRPQIPQSVKDLSTGDLEKLIDRRYEVGATQDELNQLETIYASRVSEDELNITEGLGIHGVDANDSLLNFYRQYKLPVSKRNGQISNPDLFTNIRANLPGLKNDVKDTDIINAAKDLTDYRISLSLRKKSKSISSKIENTTDALKPNTTTQPNPAAPATSLKEQPGTEKRGAKPLSKDQTQPTQPITKLSVSPLTKVSIPPVKPEEVVAAPDISDEVLQRPANQSLVTQQLAKQRRKEPTPEIQKAEVPSKFKPSDYSPDAYWEITFKDKNGVHTTFGDGVKLQAIEQKGQLLKKFSLNSEGGYINIEGLDTALTDLHGVVEEKTADFKKLAKQIGTPFFIGQKYPAFKPVYNAIQNSIDRKAEIFFEGAQMLNPKEHLKLGSASQEKVTEALKLGNSQDIQKYFTDQELIDKFKMTTPEIAAYKSVVRMYKFATNLEVASRKRLLGYDQMDATTKAKTDKLIEEQVKRLGGYISQSRLEGKWAVYQPPINEGGTARFFNLYPNKSSAEKAAGLLGSDAKVYLKQDVDKELYRHLTVADIESLAQAADVSTDSADVEAMTKELQKRNFSSHWIRRQWVPGYDWNLTNIMDSAIDYMEGAANKLTKMEGRAAAEKAFSENISKMNPEMRQYSRKFLNTYYNSGAIGIKALNKLIYSYKLAFKVSWLAQNLTQPIATTYPAMSSYLGNNTEKVFLDSYKKANRYILHKLDRKEHGLDNETIYMLGKLHRQGALGDQMTRFQLAVRHASKEEFDKWLGLFGRIAEGTNRTHAALVGMHIAKNSLGLKDKRAILEFTKEFINKTQFAYGKQNLPLLITGSGNLRNIIKTMYTFRGYSVNYLQLLNSMMPWRGAPMGQTLRTLGVSLAQSGLKGLPFAALIALGYKAITGRNMDDDTRESMEEAGIPDKAIDISLHGAYAATGADMSSLLGSGDIISTYGSTAAQIAGPVGGLGDQIGRAMFFASRGDYRRALESASPDVIRNILKGTRYAQEGVRKASGELITKPSQIDVGMQALGFNPLSVSKAYEAEDTKKALKDARSARNSFASSEIAKAIVTRDRAKVRKIMSAIHDHNSKVPSDQKIVINKNSIRNYIREYKGHDVNVPKSLRKKFRDVRRRFGQNN